MRQRRFAQCLEGFVRGRDGLIDGLEHAPVAVDVPRLRYWLRAFPQRGENLFDNLANGVG